MVEEQYTLHIVKFRHHQIGVNVVVIMNGGKTEFSALEFGDIDEAGRGSVLQHGGYYRCAVHDLQLCIIKFFFFDSG